MNQKTQQVSCFGLYDWPFSWMKTYDLIIT